jgi:hypothetical protein
MLPGYGEQMRAISLKHVPTAVLSRQTAGVPFAGCDVPHITRLINVTSVLLLLLMAHVLPVAANPSLL